MHPGDPAGNSTGQVADPVRETWMDSPGDANGMAGPATGTAGKPLVLLVDAGPDLTALLADTLEREGFRSAIARDDREALALAASLGPHLVLLDLRRSLADGIDLCRRLRRRPAMRDRPIILLSSWDREADRIAGLDAGADDYLTKPFSLPELVARMRALLRRSLPRPPDDEALQFADIHMDLVAHRVRRNGRPVHLGPTEYRLLRHFLEQPGRVLSRGQLLHAVWGADVHVEPRTVDVHVRRLRVVLNGDHAPDLIQTIRSVGYVLAIPRKGRPG